MIFSSSCPVRIVVVQPAVKAGWDWFESNTGSNFIIMGKNDKKRIKIEDEINRLESEMKKNLTQKTSNTKEISISEYLGKIANLRVKLSAL